MARGIEYSRSSFVGLSVGNAGAFPTAYGDMSVATDEVKEVF